MRLLLRKSFYLLVTSLYLSSHLCASESGRQDDAVEVKKPYSSAVYEDLFKTISEVEEPGPLKVVVKNFLETYLGESLNLPIFYSYVQKGAGTGKFPSIRLPIINDFIREFIGQQTPTLNVPGLSKTASSLAVDEILQPSLADIRNYLAERIVGEESALEALAVSSNRHLQSLSINRMLFALGQPFEPIRKSNILLVGPTGSGKTASVRHLANLLKLPFFEGDASTFSSTGYMGESVDSLIDGLIKASNNNLAAAQGGIIFIDKLDKIAAKSSYGERDIKGDGVQAELLKLIEGKTCSVPLPTPEGEKTFYFNTSQILFIGGGAFTSLPKKPAEGYTFKDLMAIGMKPELMGRFGNIVCFEGATQEKLERVLRSPTVSPFSGAKTLMKLGYNIDIHFDESCLDIIAEKASLLGAGARGLFTIVDRILEAFIANSAQHRGKSVTINLTMFPKDLLRVEAKEEREGWRNMYS